MVEEVVWGGRTYRVELERLIHSRTRWLGLRRASLGMVLERVRAREGASWSGVGLLMMSVCLERAWRKVSREVVEDSGTTRDSGVDLDAGDSGVDLDSRMVSRGRKVNMTGDQRWRHGGSVEIYKVYGVFIVVNAL